MEVILEYLTSAYLGILADSFSCKIHILAIRKSPVGRSGTMDVLWVRFLWILDPTTLHVQEERGSVFSSCVQSGLSGTHPATIRISNLLNERNTTSPSVARPQLSQTEGEEGKGRFEGPRVRVCPSSLGAHETTIARARARFESFGRSVGGPP